MNVRAPSSESEPKDARAPWKASEAEMTESTGPRERKPKHGRAPNARSAPRRKQ
jgi:hypothetical protein